MVPKVGSYIFISKAAIVDFPEPEEPTMNVVSLAGRYSETLERTVVEGLDG